MADQVKEEEQIKKLKEERAELIKQAGGKMVKRIDWKKGQFEANGKTYFIESDFSIARYAEYQSLEKELGLGMSSPEMIKEISRLHGLMDKVKFVEVSVGLNNMAQGVTRVEEREHTALKMCALFCNTADEDRTIMSKSLTSKKIEDWRAEGISQDDFFTLALNTINGFIEVYEKLTQSTSAIIQLSEDEKGN